MSRCVLGRAPGVLVTALSALGGCNLLVGLDDVNIVEPGTSKGGGGDSMAAPGGGGAGGTTIASAGGGSGGDTTSSGGGSTGGGSTASSGGAAGGTTSSSGGGPVCAQDSDCAPDVCDTTTGQCVPPTCDDGKRDGAETGPDCGGTMCPPCADGLGCSVPGDCQSGLCSNSTCQPVVCGDGHVSPVEPCDDGNTAPGDGCSPACEVESGYQCGGEPSVCGAVCGDTLLRAGEQCDDGNGTSGDGCSASCAVEAYYQCATPPGKCSPQETQCQDGADTDGDSYVDGQDPDCQLPPYAPQQGCSQYLIYRSVNPPKNIQDSGAPLRSVVVVPQDVPVARAAVLVNIKHPRATDLDLTLIPPFGQPRVLSSGNGGNGADYSETVFDGTCSLSVMMGLAPFKGCYQPEAPLPDSGQSAKGVWKLEAKDHQPGKGGALEGWALVVCVQ